MLSNTISVAPTVRWKLTDPHTKPPASDQLSLGLYKNCNHSALEISAEIYAKKGQNIVEYKDGADLTASERNGCYGNGCINLRHLRTSVQKFATEVAG